MYQVDKHLLARLLSSEEISLDWESLSTDDWNQVIALSKREGVGPQLYWVLSQSEKYCLVPRPCQVQLRAMFAATRLRNEQILQELKSLLSLFEATKLSVVALKGICFALTIYPDIGMRPMVDLDLLVPKPRLSEAMDIIMASDYIETKPEAFPGLNDLFNHSVDFYKTAAPFTALELQYSLVAEKSFSYAVPSDWFWTQTELIQPFRDDINTNSLLMLTPTAQVLYACAHAMLKHGARNTMLRWFYDLDQLIRVYADRIDWNLLLSQAEEFKWSSGVYAALTETSNLFHSPIPQDVLDALSRSFDRNSELVATYQELPATHTFEEYQKLLYLSWDARFRMLLGLIIPSPKYMRWRYQLVSQWALPQYYFIRWWGIAKDAIRTIRIFAFKNLFGRNAGSSAVRKR